MSLPYLIASLPPVALDAAPLSAAGLRALCERVLPPSQARTVAALLDDGPSDHPFVAAWRDREAQLRNAVARRRAARHGLEAALVQRPVAGCDLRLVHGVEAAFEQPDPRRRERALDELRWACLDELQGPQPLAFEVVLAYAVRLRLAARWLALDAAAGRRRVARLTEVAA